MKMVAIWLIAEAGSIICATGAVWLAVIGRDGWGWFLFVAVCLAVSAGPSEGKK